MSLPNISPFLWRKNNGYILYDGGAFAQMASAQLLVDAAQDLLSSQLADVLTADKPLSVVDVGCGTGFVLESLMKKPFDAKFGAVSFAGLDAFDGFANFWKVKFPTVAGVADAAKGVVGRGLVEPSFVCQDCSVNGDFWGENGFAGRFSVGFANFSLHWMGDLKIWLDRLVYAMLPSSVFFAAVPVLGSLAELESAAAIAGLKPPFDGFVSENDLAEILTSAAAAGATGAFGKTEFLQLGTFRLWQGFGSPLGAISMIRAAGGGNAYGGGYSYGYGEMKRFLDGLWEMQLPLGGFANIDLLGTPDDLVNPVFDGEFAHDFIKEEWFAKMGLEREDGVSFVSSNHFCNKPMNPFANRQQGDFGGVGFSYKVCLFAIVKR